MKIASFNVNGIKARLPLVIKWLIDCNPDVAVLQEIKSTDQTFPGSEIEGLGYNVLSHGQKSFNGVAILSKFPIDSYLFGLGGDTEDSQARWIEAEINSLKICVLYLPNGNPCPGPKFDYKLEWMNRFYKRALDIIQSEQKSVLLGDYNIIPQTEDAANPELWVNDALFNMESRESFRRILHLGFTDAWRVANAQTRAFTFWDYQAGSWHKNNGIRIDHILLSPNAADCLKTCQIDTYMRGEERPSDHVPIWAILGD